MRLHIIQDWLAWGYSRIFYLWVQIESHKHITIKGIIWIPVLNRRMIMHQKSSAKQPGEPGLSSERRSNQSFCCRSLHLPGIFWAEIDVFPWLSFHLILDGNKIMQKHHFSVEFVLHYTKTNILIAFQSGCLL